MAFERTRRMCVEERHEDNKQKERERERGVESARTGGRGCTRGDDVKADTRKAEEEEEARGKVKPTVL